MLKIVLHETELQSWETALLQPIINWKDPPLQYLITYWCRYNLVTRSEDSVEREVE